ncbi:MAG: hypothetical protein HY695_00160 [Deltaproteobacteria bacterium]|nr:hypothetical protein [Deltaproteobacteria bacterium]
MSAEKVGTPLRSDALSDNRVLKVRHTQAFLLFVVSLPEGLILDQRTLN